jgi:aryl-alcohol dehydrogenase-like predicted oxidoreductase
MEYDHLGNSGLLISRLAFGAMTFGQGTLVGDLVNDIDQQQADRMVARAMDAGVNFFDTADMYTSGQSEIILGKALGERRQDVVITTKCGFRSGPAVTASGLSYRYVLQAAESSLKRLGTDYIDLYLLHIPDPFTPLEETARALDDLVRKGAVRYVGFCNYPAWQAQQMLDTQMAGGLAEMITSQMYYSLLGRDIETEVVPFLDANGLGLMAWSPLASGFLTGKYTRDTPVPEDGRRARFDFPPIDVEKGYAVMDRLKQAADKVDATVAQTALAWVRSKYFVSTVIIGATTMAQLEDNLGAADLILDDADIEALDELTAPAATYPGWMQPMSYDAVVTEALS